MYCTKCGNDGNFLVVTEIENAHGMPVKYEFRCNVHKDVKRKMVNLFE